MEQSFAPVIPEQSSVFFISAGHMLLWKHSWCSFQLLLKYFVRQNILLFLCAVIYKYKIIILLIY